ATHFTVTVPANATAGTAFTFTVRALTAGNAVATGYTGTVRLTSSDGKGVLPATVTLNHGVGTFSATLKTAGGQTITAADAAHHLTGTSAVVRVAAAAATHFALGAPAAATGGL